MAEITGPQRLIGVTFEELDSEDPWEREINNGITEIRDKFWKLSMVHFTQVDTCITFGSIQLVRRNKADELVYRIPRILRWASNQQRQSYRQKDDNLRVEFKAKDGYIQGSRKIKRLRLESYGSRTSGSFKRVPINVAVVKIWHIFMLQSSHVLRRNVLTGKVEKADNVSRIRTANHQVHGTKPIRPDHRATASNWCIC
ncbi:hypothetical protein CLF_102760 [Clonorchis sinensis]|uniref:Uncharacterized protein n=1 Tax=Clonorchis sinensis TaxID=79923 RepID=G7Y8G6_CLOSI|nr:hypothetical protein CLF_102760 [Clonorchis sinensis]